MKYIVQHTPSNQVNEKNKKNEVNSNPKREYIDCNRNVIIHKTYRLLRTKKKQHHHPSRRRSENKNNTPPITTATTQIIYAIDMKNNVIILIGRIGYM